MPERISVAGGAVWGTAAELHLFGKLVSDDRRSGLFADIQRRHCTTGDLGESGELAPKLQMHGSPGVADPTPPVFPHIIVNEILNRDVPPFCDMIELFNAGTEARGGHQRLVPERQLDIPRKFRIPAGTEILPGQFLVFVCDQQLQQPSFTLYPFGFSAGGEELYLFSADATANLTGYIRALSLGGEANTYSAVTLLARARSILLRR